MATTVTRRDSGTLGKVQRTPQGGALVPAIVARAGLLVYQTPTGIRREYRPASEAFAPESLATLANAPVTLEHPPKKIDPTIYRQYTRGNVSNGSVAVKDGRLIGCDLAIQDDELLSDIEAERRVECSAGYDCTLIPSVNGRAPDGTECDFIQTAIRYNHVAVTEKGRAGDEVCLRLDAAGNELVPSQHGKEKVSIMRQVTIDGMLYNVGPNMTDADAQALQTALSRQTQRFDSENGRSAGELQSLRHELASEKEKRAAAEKRAEKASRFDAEDVVILDKVRGILGPDFDPTGKTPDELISAVVAKALPEISLEGKSPEYIRGLFDGIKVPTATADAMPDDPNATETCDAEGESQEPPPAEQRNDSFARTARNLAVPVRGTRADSQERPETPREAMVRENRERGSRPLHSGA